MQTVLSVISTALPVFVALGIGMFCRSSGFLTREVVEGLKKVIINLTLPFVLFQSFASADYSPSAFVQPALIFVTCCIMLALGFLWIKVSKSDSKSAPFLASGFESGMLGFSLFALLFPNESASKFAVLVLGQEIFVFTLYKMLLTGKTSPKAILNDFLTSPTLIAVILGLVVGATGLYGQFRNWGISGVIESVTSFISAPTGMIILLTVGYDLVPKEIPWKRTAGLIALRLAVMAVILGITVLLNRTLLNGIIFEWAMVLMVILPPPYVIPVFADEPAERVQISSALSALTLLTMILFAALSVLTGFQ